MMMKTIKSRGVQLLGWVLVLVALLSCQKEEGVIILTPEDQQAIETLARDLPLILSNEGWEAYESTFSDDYLNWSMARDEVRSREDYLALVKDWYDQGNRATGSTLKTIDFIPLTENAVMYLYALQEEFNDPADSTKTLTRDIRFVATYQKESGSWKNAFTAFMDLPQHQ